MKVTVQSIHFDAARKLLDLIERKSQKLETFHDRIIDCQVYLRLDNADDTANKITEMKLNIPGNVLFVKEQRKTFEEGTDLCIEALVKQLKKQNEKSKSHASEPTKVINSIMQEED